MYYVVKRDGTTVPFDETKITQAVYKAAMSCSQNWKDDEAVQIATEITKLVKEHFMRSDELNAFMMQIREEHGVRLPGIDSDESFNIEDIQDCVERKLMEEGYTDIAKSYILYRQQRTDAREAKSLHTKIVHDLLEIDAEESDSKRENANIDGNSVCGTMLQIAGAQTKHYLATQVRKPVHEDMHERGVIHENDRDFACLCVNCVSWDTNIVLRTVDGSVLFTIADYFRPLGLGVHRFDDLSLSFDILDSNNTFTPLKGVSIRHESSHINKIETPHGILYLTDNHIVPIRRNHKDIEVCAKDIQVGDGIHDCYVDVVPLQQKLTEINIVDYAYLLPLTTVVHESHLLRTILSNKEIEYPGTCIGSSMDRCMYLNEYVEKRHIFKEYNIDERTLHFRLHTGKHFVPGMIPLTMSLGRLLGLYCSDGCAIKYGICFTSKSDELIQDWIQLVQSCFPDTTYTVSMNANHTQIVNVHSGILGYLCKHGILMHHYGSSDIELPSWFMYANKPFLQGFLSGLLDGDGNLNLGVRYFGYTTCSQKLIYQIQYLLKRFNVSSTVYQTDAKGSTATFTRHESTGSSEVVTSLRRYDSWHLDARMHQIADKVRLHEVLDCLKWNNYISQDGPVNRPFKYSEGSDPVRYNRVRKISQIPYDNVVYDFETGSHYFSANGLRIHNCLELPMDRLWEKGFATGHGYLRPPATIGSAATQICIAIQSNQNDMFGGQAIPMFDYYLAPYVAKSYVRNVLLYLSATDPLVDYDPLKHLVIPPLDDYIKKHQHILTPEGHEQIAYIYKSMHVRYTDECKKWALMKTERDTYQAMEAFIHNLCTLQCLPGSSKIWVLDVANMSYQEILDVKLMDRYMHYTLADVHHLKSLSLMSMEDIYNAHNSEYGKYVYLDHDAQTVNIVHYQEAHEYSDKYRDEVDRDPRYQDTHLEPTIPRYWVLNLPYDNLWNDENQKIIEHDGIPLDLVPIERIYRNSNHRRLVKLTTESGRTCTTTDNHRWLVLHHGVDRYGDSYEQIEYQFPEQASEVLIGNSIVCTKTTSNLYEVHKNDITPLKTEFIPKDEKWEQDIKLDVSAEKIVKREILDSEEEYVYDLSIFYELYIPDGSDNCCNFVTEDMFIVHNSRSGGQTPFS